MAAQVHQCDICIIGNGAVGKAAALGLAQAGWRVLLLARSAAPLPLPPTAADWDVRVFALNHVARDLLSGLKVWDALDATRVAPVSAMQIFDMQAALPAPAAAKLGFDAYGAHTEQLTWIVEDRNLNQALDSALRFAQNLTQLVGEAVDWQISENLARLRLADGSTIEAKLLVGADGAQSWVRAQADIGIDYRSYGQRGVVTNFACEQPHHGVARQWFVEDQGIIALLPLPGQRVSLVWSAPDALAATLLAEPLSALATRLETYCFDTLGHLTPLQPAHIQAFPLRLIRPHSMIAPRMALIGDAAHAVHPLAGHGMNLGFGDVASLLTILADAAAKRDCGDLRLLERYRRARKEEVMLMQLTTDGLARLFASQLTPLRLVRKFGLNLLEALPVLKRKLISHAMGSR